MTIATWKASLTVVLPALFLGACLDDGEPSLGSAEQGVIQCPLWGRRQNPPENKAWDFWELDEAGQPNSAGIRLIDMKKNGNTYQVNVVGSRLYGTSRVLPTLQGTALIGAYMEVLTPEGVYQIQIKNVSNATPYWEGPETTVET